MVFPESSFLQADMRQARQNKVKQDNEKGHNKAVNDVIKER